MHERTRADGNLTGFGSEADANAARSAIAKESERGLNRPIPAWGAGIGFIAEPERHCALETKRRAGGFEILRRRRRKRLFLFRNLFFVKLVV